MTRILIVGAGIGGLTLANALRGSNLEIRLVERDASLDARSQGYGIGLRNDTGLAVLERLGLAGEVKAIGRPAIAFPFLDRSGQRLMTLAADPAAPHSSLSVPRDRLRKLLLERIPDDAITWGKRCIGVGDTGVARFADGSEEEADVIVACDGARSCLREEMTGDAPRPLGLFMIGGLTRRAPRHALLEGGAFMTLGPGRSMFVQIYDHEGSTIWSLCLREDLVATIPSLEDRTALRTLALSMIDGWHAPLRELVEATDDDDTTVRRYFDRMPPRSWRRGSLVLLGDAAHSMSPFQGQGANTAMLDAIDLATALTSDHADLGAALDAYQAKAGPRGSQAVRASRYAAAIFHLRHRFASSARDAGLRWLDRRLASAR